MLFAVDVDGVVGDGVGDAKVDEFEAAFEEEEVGRFEVGVHDVVGVDGLQAFKHFFPEVAGECDIEFGVVSVQAKAEEVLKIGLAQFHEDTEGMLFFVDFEVKEADDAVDVFEFAEEVNFAFVALDGEFVLVF